MRFGFKKAAQKSADAPKDPSVPRKPPSARSLLDNGYDAADIGDYMEVTGYSGAPEDVADIAGRNMAYSEKKPLFDGAAKAYLEGRPENLRHFFRAYADFKSGTDTSKQIDDGYKTLLLMPILELMEALPPPAQTLESLTACISGTAVLLRLRELLLRQACIGDYKAETVDCLLDTGVNIHVDGERPLLNALLREKTDLARRLVARGASLDSARKAAAAYEKKEAVIARVDALDMAIVAESGSESDIRNAAARMPCAHEAKAPLLARGLAAFAAGDARPLQAFYAGYAFGRRGDETNRKIDSGYKTLLLNPLTSLLQKSNAPARDLRLLLGGMTDKDRQRALDLMLRHVCGGVDDIALARVLLEGGADACALNNQPLVAAVRAGHTAIAMMLIRDYGANIADAILDTQLNAPGETTLLQKLYTCMAATYPAAAQKPLRLRLEK